MKLVINFLLFISFFNSLSQESPNFTAVDSLYREDQFYASLMFNFLENKNSGINQGKLSLSFSFGILRDMPINKKRTLAIAPGIGYSINNYNHNLFTVQNNITNQYKILSTSFDKNKQILHYIDLPIEFRWRNSTPESHKFYRIYLGFKASYLIFDQLNLESETLNESVNSNSDLNNFQFGTYLSIGNNTINFYTYYGLNSIFKSGNLNNEPLQLKTLNFGFMFYIL